jgi:putative spermidine/putrescine transport system permease protein
MESRAARILVRAGSVFTLLFLYVPLAIVVLYAFNNSIGQRWPITSFTMRYVGQAWRNPLVREALFTSLEVAVAATALALLLGSMAAFAVHRFQFFGRNSISFVLVLPIALPGIVTAMALNSAINTVGIPFSVLTIVVGHATFCVVVVYNNVVARLRRTPTSLVEASMDLGADGWQTFRFVTFPAIRTAIMAGALLAFALSFDEIVVTNFTSGTQLTIPKFIFNNVRQPRNRPIVNVVAVALILLSLIPVYFAQRLAGGAGLVGATTSSRGDRESDDTSSEEASGTVLAEESAGPRSRR